jgi:hypothetical protein
MMHAHSLGRAARTVRSFQWLLVPSLSIRPCESSTIVSSLSPQRPTDIADDSAPTAKIPRHIELERAVG